MEQQDKKEQKDSASRRVFYGKDTKRRVVFDYQHGSASAAELARLYGIMGSNTVDDWLKRFGNLAKKMNIRLVIIISIAK